MLSIRSSADLARALASPIDANLKKLLTLRSGQLLEHDLGEFANFHAVEADDTVMEVEATLGFDPSTNLVDGARHGEPDFTPSWEWMERHPGWTELTFVLTDDGFAHVLLVPERDDIDARLLALCRDHA